MVTVQMLTCRPGGFRLWSALAVLAAISGGCQRVPLLAPTGSSITLTATTTALSANGTATIIGQIIEAAGTPPHSGTHVTFTTTLGRIEPSEASTDINGRVTTTFIAGGSNGTATISALSGGATTGADGALKIFVGTAAVANVNVSASPNPVPALGGSTTVTARVLDVNGNPLVATPVSFTTTAGTLSSSVALTEANGAATSILTTSTQATVTASVGAQGSSSTTTPPAGGTTPASSGQSSGTVIVTVAGSPTVTITAPTTPLSAGVAAPFTFVVTPAAANASPIRSVTVNWGDGQPVQDLGTITGSTTVSHTYRSSGSYAITATVVDSFGTTVLSSTSVVVNPTPQPVVTLTAPTTTPTAGTDMLFIGSVAVAGNTGSVIEDVVIEYGDGSIKDLGAITGTAIPLHHVYVAAGTYTATLTATDSNGGRGRAATSVFVQTATPLAVSLTSSQASSGGNTTVSFTATVIGLGNAVVVNYHWVFGGSNGTADTPTNQQTRTYPIGSGPITVSVMITTSDGRTATGQTVITP
jgi:adhesin/invasin